METTVLEDEGLSVTATGTVSHEVVLVVVVVDDGDDSGAAATTVTGTDCVVVLGSGG